MRISYKIKKTGILFLKIVIILASYYFVFDRILNSPDIENIKYYFIETDFARFLLLISIVILMFVNWATESVKWKLLVRPLEELDFITTFKAIWTGITIGMVTPNRIGEFGGRILFLKKENRIKATSLTLYGDLSQFIVTIVFGIIGFYFISGDKFFQVSEIKQFENIIWITGTLVIVVTLFFYFNIDYCLNLMNKIKFLKSLVARFKPDYNISPDLKTRTLILSILRYITFSVQFYLTLLFFGVEISFINSLIATSSIYLSLNIIPNIPFAEIALRSSFAVIFLGFYSDKVTAIVLASLLIYIINVGVPTLAGGWFLLKQKNKKVNTTEVSMDKGLYNTTNL